MGKNGKVVLIAAFFFFGASDARSWPDKTHKAVTEQALTNIRSVAGSYAQDQLGLEAG